MNDNLGMESYASHVALFLLPTCDYAASSTVPFMERDSAGMTIRPADGRRGTGRWHGGGGGRGDGGEIAAR